MKSFSNKHWALPSDLKAPLILMLSLMLFTAWNQSHWWYTLPDNYFGWLTPAFALFILIERKQRLLALWRKCGRAGSSRINGPLKVLANSSAAFLFITGLSCLIIGACHRAASGPSVKGTFVVSVGVALLILSSTWLVAPSAPYHTNCCLTEDSRYRLCTLLLYPSLVWLLSEPLLSIAETQFSAHLLAPIAATISWVFNLLGFPIFREGNVLLMPDHGRIGVEEACTGIRSFAASIYAGSFLGAEMLRSCSQKALLLAIAVAVAAILNFCRSIFLTTWAWINGTASIEGRVHDLAGYFVMGLTILLLLILLRVLMALFKNPT